MIQAYTADTVADEESSARDSSISSSSLRCHWCAVTLQMGVATCPTCGSSGIPDHRMSVPGSDSTDGGDVATPARASVDDLSPGDIETSDRPPTTSNVSYLDIEDRQLQTYGIIIVSVVVCAAIGWLAGPLLAGPMESLTGTPVANTSDLRPTGGFLGMLAAFLVGATSGWIIWSGR